MKNFERTLRYVIIVAIFFIVFVILILLSVFGVISNDLALSIMKIFIIALIIGTLLYQILGVKGLFAGKIKKNNVAQTPASPQLPQEAAVAKSESVLTMILYSVGVWLIVSFVGYNIFAIFLSPMNALIASSVIGVVGAIIFFKKNGIKIAKN
ncbi:MAG TPA: hypothetical protein VMC41_04645 [Candidatus Nanoarchaeia archaeon]|nr:hypothetical protein [Candidatus Nanoarchaeia archaeon]